MQKVDVLSPKVLLPGEGFGKLQFGLGFSLLLENFVLSRNFKK